MAASARRPLTDRQRAVMERIDRRLPIKVIAQELNVSETRINQHIRALKNYFQAETLNELVEHYRSIQDTETKDINSFSNPEYIKRQLPEEGLIADYSTRDSLGEALLNDAAPRLGEAPWEWASEPKVVPGVLDGDNAILVRFGAILGIAFGVLTTVILVATASILITEAVESNFIVPEDYVRSE